MSDWTSLSKINPNQTVSVKEGGYNHSGESQNRNKTIQSSKRWHKQIILK